MIEQDAEIARAVLGFVSSGGDVAEHVTSASGLFNGEELPDVVVVRAELPGDDGVVGGCSVADGIKAGERTGGLPVVVYCTDPATVESHRAGVSPADAYLPWPFSADALLDQIHMLTDGAALAAPESGIEAGGEHLLGVEEVPAEGELEELFNTPLPAPGSEAPTVSIPDLPEISAELIQPIEPMEVIEPVQTEDPGPTPLPDSDNLARTMYDPLAVGLTHEDDERDELDEPDADVIAGPAPGLAAADLELQELVDGLDASALESTREIPAVDDDALDALAAEAALPLPEAPSPLPEAPSPLPEAPSLDAAVEAEFGAALPPPPPPSALPSQLPVALADTTLDSPPVPQASAHNEQMEAALEAAGRAARAAKEQAEAARTQVEEIATKLGMAKDEAASERARAAALLESLEAERARAAALEQDVTRLTTETAKLRAESEQLRAAVAELTATAADMEQARQATAALAAAHAGELSERDHRIANDAAVFERVGKAVRIAAALLEERSRNQ